jgi:hypothetical protein
MGVSHSPLPWPANADPLSPPQVPSGTDVHLHLVHGDEPVTHVNYAAAMALALISLLVGRRLPKNVAAFGDVSPQGSMGTRHKLSLADVESCRRAGIRRMLVPAMLKLEAGVKEALETPEADGKPALELVRETWLLDALPAMFDDPGAPALQTEGMGDAATCCPVRA